MIRLCILFGLAILLTSCEFPKTTKVDAWSVSHASTRTDTNTGQSKGKNLPYKQLARYQVLYDFEDWYDELYKNKNFDKIERFINKSLETGRKAGLFHSNQ